MTKRPECVVCGARGPTKAVAGAPGCTRTDPQERPCPGMGTAKDAIFLRGPLKTTKVRLPGRGR